MKQIEVYVVRFIMEVPDALMDILYYIVFLILSTKTMGILLNISNISEFLSSFGSTFGTLIFFAIISIIFISYCSIYTYLNFVKFTTKELIQFFSITGIFTFAMLASRWLSGQGVGGELLLDSLEQVHSVSSVVTLFSGMLCGLIVISRFRRGKPTTTTHFKYTCFAINNLGKSQNNEMCNYKNMHKIYSASKGYKSGIKGIKNLLMRGIDLDGFFDLDAGLCLNEILDWLTFSMQYYLFYGGPEQMEAVKNHLERMVGNFDDNYRINANQFMHETLRMYNEMNAYFKENNINIACRIKFTDRLKGYLPQALLAITSLTISIITKDFILKLKPFKKMSILEYDILKGDVREFKIIVEPFTYSKDYNVSIGASCK